MRRTSAIFLVAAATLAPLGRSLAEAPVASNSTTLRDEPAKPVKSKTANPKSAKAKTPAPETTGAAPPCVRGQWAGDPACFGENDPAALPTPSGRSSDKGARRAGDVSLTPKGGVNTAPRAEQDPIPFSGNNPNPKPSVNDFGGGLGVNFPF